MSNTDGEDTQRIKAKQILTEAIGKDCVFSIDGKMWNTGNLNANTIVDSMLEYADQKLTSLREQLATEQDMRSTAEFANRMIIKDLNEKLKQKEDENRELVDGIKNVVTELRSKEAEWENHSTAKASVFDYAASKIESVIFRLSAKLGKV